MYKAISSSDTYKTAVFISNLNVFMIYLIKAANYQPPNFKSMNLYSTNLSAMDFMFPSCVEVYCLKFVLRIPEVQDSNFG
jgi:hypothetical protein